jgi:hypothetical protein
MTAPKLGMTMARRTGLLALLALLASGGISILWGSKIQRTSATGMADFKAVYFGARCLLRHSDPYKPNEFLTVYKDEGGQIPSEPVLAAIFRRAVPICVNLPTSLLMVAPLALMPLSFASNCWLILTSGCLIIAAILIADIACGYSRFTSLLLLCILLSNCEILISSGNLAGIAVGGCVIAVWCFLRKRYIALGVISLSASLLLKPHDAGLVLLYFLFAGGVPRKWALQCLAVTFVLGLAAVLWVSPVAPQWIPELRQNLSTTSAHGDVSDPGPSSMSARSPEMIIDLQSVISVFWDVPRFYNLLTYFVCGILFTIWAAVTATRTRLPMELAWLALAGIAPLTLLFTYHRPYDAKILLLSIPACSILWMRNDCLKWTALLTSLAGVIFTGDVPLSVLQIIARGLKLSGIEPLGKTLTVILTRPAPIALLMMAVFYVWVYVRDSRANPITFPETRKSKTTPIGNQPSV